MGLLAAKGEEQGAMCRDSPCTSAVWKVQCGRLPDARIPLSGGGGYDSRSEGHPSPSGDMGLTLGQSTGTGWDDTERRMGLAG